jgi:CubicO group peptidase (beta-lactamase class C family)
MRHHPSVRFMLAVALLLAPPVADAQAPRAASVVRLDSIAGAGVAQKRAVGIVAAVVKGNDTLLLKSYGKANLEWDVPMPVDAMFEIGSIAKQFTAAAVLQLRDEGKLSLDDDLTKWVPDFDTRGNRVPLRRLLDHTSGIHGITEMPEFMHLATNPRFPRDSAYALIKRYPFHFATGAAQVYNNSAYLLLGLIIEKASGMSYEDYVEQRIFAPLGMTRSMYCNSTENVARRAHGYVIQNGIVRRAAANVHTWPFAAGSICSTAGDLVTWLKALHGGKVLSPKSYAEMTSPATLADGTPLRYGMGISVGKNYGGQLVIGHGGTIDGFKSEASWYPDAQMAVVVLVNSSSNLDVATELGAVMLPWKQPVFTKFAGDPEALVGRYQGPSRGRDMILDVTRTPQGLAFSVNGSPPRQLPHVGGLTWQGGTAFITFRRHSDGGKATEVRFDAGNGHYVLTRREPPASP